jgi:hypothetical protein
MGYRFHWAGYLDRCFELHYFANKSSPLSNALKFIERYFTPNAGVTHYIFLWEDTQPIGLSLSLGLKDITGMNVVCVAHGYEFAHNPERVGMDGKNCKFNLVYDSKQAEFYNDSTTFILGLPYEVEPASNIKSKIVLVEHTGMDSGIEYINSVYHFIKLYKVLENAGYEIIYRPRPGSDTSYAMSIFKNVNNEDKSNLFSEGRMIFIGFSSTLLYEAKAFGNIVIGLDTSEFVDKRNFDVHLTLLPHDYKKLPTIVSQIMDNGFEMFIEKVDGLSLRFYKCLESIDNCKMSHE